MVPPELVTFLDEKQKLQKLQKLWLHESVRVFSDRLINEEDKALFLQTME